MRVHPRPDRGEEAGSVNVITTVRTARKPHQCAKCLGRIEPGEQYVDARLAPGSDLGNEGWWRLASHVGAYPEEDR
jgi:hypothetical protein